MTNYKVSATRGLLNGITFGSDSALWATAPNENKIFRMTTNGTVSEFPLPTADSQPNAITVGPDGGLWFTEAKKIGRLGR
jgi:virginiamycin B lyase